MLTKTSELLKTDIKICTCPECRFARGEISSSEYAWYLKGKIEARDADLRVKDKGEFGPDHNLFKSYESYLKSSRMDDEACLSELLESLRKPEKIDQAWLEPRNYLLEKKNA